MLLSDYLTKSGREESGGLLGAYDRLGDSGRFEGVQRDLIGEQPQPQHGTQMEAGLPRERPHGLRIRR